MDNMIRKINNSIIAMQCSLFAFKNRVKNEERGDTNFLSIIIILGIVLVLAVVFIAFKDQIIETVSGAWTEFQSKFSSQKKGI